MSGFDFQRGTALACGLAILMLVAGCMSSPDSAAQSNASTAASNTSSAPAANVAQPRGMVELFPGGNHTSPVSAVTAGPTRPDNSGKPLEARPGEKLVPRVATPDQFPLPPVAEPGIIGLYLPTLDHTRVEDYGLMIYRQANGSGVGAGDKSPLCWMLLRNRQEPDMMGFGTLQERSGGYEFVELERTSNNSTRELAIQQFHVESRPNCWTIDLPVASPVGEDKPTALGKLMTSFGSKVYWVRTSVAGENDQRLATAAVVGSFSPLSVRLPDNRPGFTVDPQRYLAIWPDATWALVVESSDGQRDVISGSLEITDDGRTLKLTQTLPADPNQTDNPPTAEFSFVYDAADHVLWLTRKAGSTGLPGVLPAEPGDEHTVVYVLRIERAER